MSLGLTDGKGVADVWRSGAAEAGGESCVCYFGIEVVGVEVVTQPLTPLGVLWMSRIGEDFEQLTVAPGAAAILGWTPALSGGADGTGQSLDGGRIAVLPALDVECVEMVVFPPHGGLDRAMQVTERRLTGNQEPAPDRWFRAAQRHLQADHLPDDAALRHDGSGHHGLLPSRAASTARCMTVVCVMGPWRASGFMQQSA